MRYPIVIFAFDRLDYLAALLHSLKAQTDGAMAGREVHLFQDGAACAWTGHMRTDRELTLRSIELFRTAFPEGRVHFTDANLGIALQWHRGEEFIFGERQAPAAYLLEDDTVLAPHYLDMADHLIDRAREHGRIAYVSAFGDPTASPEEQRAGARHLQQMEHIWGAAMLRDYWEKERRVIAPYYRMMCAQPYCNRPHDEILQLLCRTLGSGRGTAQDSAKEAAAIALGYARLTTRACHARYIGERGVHFNRTIFERFGFDRTQLYPEPVFDLILPDTAEIDRLIAEQNRDVRIAMHNQTITNPGLFRLLATPVRVGVEPGHFLRLADDGHLVTSTDSAAASPFLVLSWQQADNVLFMLKDDSGRWLDLDTDRSLVMREIEPKPDNLPFPFFRKPGNSEPFMVIAADARAFTHDPGSGILKASATTNSEAAKFRLLPAG